MALKNGAEIGSRTGPNLYVEAKVLISWENVLGPLAYRKKT